MQDAQLDPFYSYNILATIWMNGQNNQLGPKKMFFVFLKCFFIKFSPKNFLFSELRALEGKSACKNFCKGSWLKDMLLLIFPFRNMKTSKPGPAHCSINNLTVSLCIVLKSGTHRKLCWLTVCRTATYYERRSQR